MQSAMPCKGRGEGGRELGCRKESSGRGWQRPRMQERKFWKGMAETGMQGCGEWIPGELTHQWERKGRVPSQHRKLILNMLALC